MNIFRSNTNKKLYKFIYKTGYSSYSERFTLLITGVSPTDAVDRFYKRAGDKVSDILEFTEIKYNSEGAEVRNERIK